MKKSTLYRRAAILLHAVDYDKDTLAELLDCSPHQAATLMSLYNTCEGIPEVMQEKANAASRESKRRAKAKLKALMREEEQGMPRAEGTPRYTTGSDDEFPLNKA